MRAPSRGLATPIALAVILSAIFAFSADAATVTLAWDPSPDETVIGYQVYIGTISGSYTETYDVGLATSFSYNPQDASVYYFAVAAYSPGPVLGPRSSEVSTAPKTNDAATYWSSLWASRSEAMLRARRNSESPTVEITVPTNRNSYSTDEPFLTLGGRVIHDGVVTEVTWTTNRGHRGRATGTENWIAGIPLQRGRNTITVWVRDEEGNVSSRAIVVNLMARRSAPLLRLGSQIAQ